MKHRRLLPLLAFVALAAVLFTACVAAPSPRGWAAPVESPQGHLLVTTSRGKLDAIDRETGGKVWTFPDHWHIENKDARRLGGIYAQPVVANGMVYIADYNGFVYAIHPTDVIGRTDQGSKPEARVRRLGSPVIGGMALDQATNTLFITTDDGRLHALNAGDFTNRYEPARAGDRIWAAPTLVGGRVYFASTDRRVYAIDAATGRQAWPPFTAGGALVSQPVVASNSVLVGGFNNVLYALDAATGAERWSFRAANWVWSRPLVSGDRVYVADFDGSVYALRLSNGEVLWAQAYQASESIRSAPIILNGVLVVVTERGEMHGIDPATGSRVWGPVRTEGAVHADLVPLGNSVVVAPSTCVEFTRPDETKRKVNFFLVDPTTGTLQRSLAEKGC